MKRGEPAAVGAARLRLALQGSDFDGRPAAATLRRWLRRALDAEAEITLRFVGAREGRRLNREFRGRDYATNVLTFGYGRAPIVADIVVCAPVVAREARRQGKPLRAHLAHLVIHGALHARGLRHDTAGRARRMEHLEARLLAELGYPDPYSEACPAPEPGQGARRRPRSA